MSDRWVPRSAARVVLSVIMALSLVVAATAGASGQSATSKISGCRFFVSDGLSVLLNVTVGSSATCGNNTRFEWNLRGTRGPKGAKGLRGLQGKRGPRGEAGQDGARGARGAPGLRGPAVDQSYASTGSSQGSGGRLLVADALCKPGDIATGGGFDTNGIILASIGIGAESPTGWRAIAQASEETTDLTVMAICVTPTRDGGGAGS